jgi:hypothetical protein
LKNPQPHAILYSKHIFHILGVAVSGAARSNTYLRFFLTPHENSCFYNRNYKKQELDKMPIFKCSCFTTEEEDLLL